MEQRLSLITLGVADLDRAKAFYENVVGWQPAPIPPEIVFFDLGGVILSLFPIPNSRKIAVEKQIMRHIRDSPWPTMSEALKRLMLFL